MLDPDASLRLIGLMGALLAGSAAIGLTRNTCDHEECAKTCARITRIEKVAHHTKLHEHHSIPDRDCERCQDRTA